MDDCIFCRIVRGELPASKIHEDEHTLSFLNIVAAHPGHALVIVKPHVENIYDLDDTRRGRLPGHHPVARPSRPPPAATASPSSRPTKWPAGRPSSTSTSTCCPLQRRQAAALLARQRPSREALDAMAERLRAVI
jgi:histidine triad (HIT) family protein